MIPPPLLDATMFMEEATCSSSADSSFEDDQAALDDPYAASPEGVELR